VVRIHVTALNRVKLILLRVSFLVVLGDCLPLEACFRCLVLLETNHSISFPKGGNIFIGDFLTIFFVLIFFLMNFLMISFY